MGEQARSSSTHIEDGVRLIGNVIIGEGVSIGAPSELMAKNSCIKIGDECDIASYVTITTADSHKRCIGFSAVVSRREVFIEQNVFIGQGAIILGGTRIGHHSVIGAGVVLGGEDIPPYSRVRASRPIIERGYYLKDLPPCGSQWEQGLSCEDCNGD